MNETIYQPIRIVRNNMVQPVIDATKVTWSTLLLQGIPLTHE